VWDHATITNTPRGPRRGRKPSLVRKGRQARPSGKPNTPRCEEIEGLVEEARVESIRGLVLLGRAEVGRIMDAVVVERLPGPRHGQKAEGKDRSLGPGATRAWFAPPACGIRYGCGRYGTGTVR
jgi:hypothetical protein